MGKIWELVPATILLLSIWPMISDITKKKSISMFYIKYNGTFENFQLWRMKKMSSEQYKNSLKIRRKVS